MHLTSCISAHSRNRSGTQCVATVAGRLKAVVLPEIDNPFGTDRVRPRYEYEYDAYGNQRRIVSNAYLVGNTVYYLQKENGVDVVSATRPLWDDALPDPEDTTSTLFTYDELHRQRSRQLPLGVIGGSGFTETQAYNGLGQLTLSVDFEGRHTAFQYDTLGRLAKRLYFTDNTAYLAWLPIRSPTTPTSSSSTSTTP
jgi:YD repeat-containing protein